MPVLGTERRELPARVPATLRVDGDDWTITLHYFARHEVMLHFAGGPGPTLREPGGETDALRFGLAAHTSVSCDPPSEVRPDPPGTSWTHTCRARTDGVIGSTQDIASRDTMAGIESLCIGGTTLDAWHVRRMTTVSGSEAGTVRRDAWFSTTDGMLLRLELETRTSGIAEHVESIRLELESLVPQT